MRFGEFDARDAMDSGKIEMSKVSPDNAPGRMIPLQKAFSAIFTSLIELEAYSETNDDFHINIANKHYDIFKDTLPFELCYMDEYSSYSDSVFIKGYRENNLPWFSLSADQIDDIETVRYFAWQTTIRMWDKEKINDIIPSLMAFSKVYFDVLKDKHSMSQDFLEFKEKAKAIPSFERSPKSPTAKVEDKINALLHKVTTNYPLYFLLAFIFWLVVTFILVYLPCRVFFDASPKMLAPVVFATAITLALMDVNKNVKTDLTNKRQQKEIELNNYDKNTENSK